MAREVKTDGLSLFAQCPTPFFPPAIENHSKMKTIPKPSSKITISEGA